jgi:IclR family acetate operon transcriptional repressor
MRDQTAEIARAAETQMAAGGALVGVDRVLALAHRLAEFPGGVALEELARLTGYPKSSVHRGLAALRRAGFARQDELGRYLLGDDFLRLAYEFHAARPDLMRVRPAMDDLVSRMRETVHYMVLDGADIVYQAKVDPARAAVQLTSAIGGRNPAHATAGGKALLAQLLPDREAVESWVGLHGPLVRRTEDSITTVAALADELEDIRRRGFALDREENERGVNCLAFAVWLTSPRQPSGALSVSALGYRCGVDELLARAPEIRQIIVGALGDVVR